MCGRYSQTQTVETIALRYDLADQSPLSPRYNIAPSQPAPVIINDGGSRKLDLYQWGLIPSWAKDPGIGSKMINARAETVQEKPSYKRLTRKRRCLVVSDGFYEWRRNPGGQTKTPMRVLLKSKTLFSFAGLWDSWQDRDGRKIRSFTIITSPPNSLLRSIHSRMPVILRKTHETDWLNPEIDLEEMGGVFEPYPEGEMEYYPVTTLVNSPRNDGPECFAPDQNILCND